MAKKQKILPVETATTGPPNLSESWYVGDFHAYKSGEGSEVWYQSESEGRCEPFGSLFETATGRWGVFCTRHATARLVAVAEDFELAVEKMFDAYWNHEVAEA